MAKYESHDNTHLCLKVCKVFVYFILTYSNLILLVIYDWQAESKCSSFAISIILSPYSAPMSFYNTLWYDNPKPVPLSDLVANFVNHLGKISASTPPPVSFMLTIIICCWSLLLSCCYRCCHYYCLMLGFSLESFLKSVRRRAVTISI